MCRVHSEPLEKSLSSGASCYCKAVRGGFRVDAKPASRRRFDGLGQCRFIELPKLRESRGVDVEDLRSIGAESPSGGMSGFWHWDRKIVAE